MLGILCSVSRLGSARGKKTNRGLLGFLCCFAMFILGTGGSAMPGWAASDVTSLVAPTTAVPNTLASGLGVRHLRTTLRAGGKAELLFLGTLVDGGSTAERWPVVKALTQFGTLSGVSPVISRDCLYQLVALVPRLQCGPTEEHGFITGLATFDWSHTVYHSRYLVFVHKDLIDQNLRMRAKLSPLERSLFIKYVALPGFNGYHDTVWHTAVDQHSVEGMLHLSHRSPLLVVGRSVETGNNVAISGDLHSSTGRTVLPFDAVQQSLMSGHAQGGAPATLVPDYNVETNVITALICTADGLQPRAVCGRPVIRTILTALKRGPAYLTAALIKLRSQRGAL